MWGRRGGPTLAGMSTTVTRDYQMFVPRRRRIGTGAAVAVGPTTTNSIDGDHYADLAPGDIGVHYPDAGAASQIAHFLFWSVRGAADGDRTDANASLDVALDGTPVHLTAWYALPGGGGLPGTGDPELETDAFVVELNQFIEPTPIASVSPAAMWDPSDVQEFVFTSEPSDVTALSSMNDPHELFEHWYVLEGGAVANGGPEIHVPQGDNGIAIATYRVPKTAVVKPPHDRYETGGIIVGGVAHDGSGGIIINGILHPIGPWDPWLATSAVLRAARGLPAEARVQVERAALRAAAGEARLLERGIGGKLNGHTAGELETPIA